MSSCVLNSNGAIPALQKMTALLPAKPQLAVYLNMPAIGRLAGVPVNAPECPPVGFALHALPAGIEAQFVIPFETIETVFKQMHPPGERR